MTKFGARKVELDGHTFASAAEAARYGRLVVVAVGKRNDAIVWRCRCDCGSMTDVLKNNVIRGRTVSCGCKRNEARIKHGHSGSPEYNSWKNMVKRCTDPNEIGYSRYGGRGITVCERWLKLENFLADMGARPPGKTLDRIDNDGPYEPGNCRWATKREQVTNTRIRTFDLPAAKELLSAGMSMAEVSRQMGFHPNSLSVALRNERRRAA